MARPRNRRQGLGSTRGGLRGTVGPTTGGLHGGSGFSLPPRGPVLPPSGTYDPALDAALAASHRGLLDVRQDSALGLTRAGQDYTFGQEDINRTQARGTEDLNRTQSRGDEDFTRNTQALQRSYNILAGQQQEGRNAALLGGGGGAALQAAQKRQANQAIEQGGLNLAHTRLGEDVATSRTRLGEDTQTGLGRLGVGFNRQVTDYGTGEIRAQREDTQFGLDTNSQRYFQAAQYGWQPPKKPKRR